MKKEQYKYFISYRGVEHEVTKKEYIQAERANGFISKFGDTEIATSHWGTSNGISGRIENKKGLVF